MKKNEASQKIEKLNKESIKPLKVRFCPQCKATDVGFVFRMKNIFGLLPKVECMKCGFNAHEFPLLVTTKGEAAKRAGKKKTVRKKKR